MNFDNIKDAWDNESAGDLIESRFRNPHPAAA